MQILSFILKGLIAVLATPIAIAMTMSLYRGIKTVGELSGNMPFFLAGVVAYIVIHVLFYKPTAAYVFGHEAIHAIASWLCGGKLSGFKVSKEGGSVTTDKTNTLVELAPYFVPLYAIIVMALYYVVAQSYKINGSIFIFLIGFTLAFHVITTIEVMKTAQPDFVKSGYFFSIVIVYLMNIMVIAGIFSALFSSFSLQKLVTDTCILSKGMYVGLYRQVFG